MVIFVFFLCSPKFTFETEPTERILESKMRQNVKREKKKNKLNVLSLLRYFVSCWARAHLICQSTQLAKQFTTKPNFQETKIKSIFTLSSQ